MTSGTLPLVNRFDLNKSSLIEASAGTGKTFTISNLILRLLMGAPNLQKLSEKQRKELVNSGHPLDIENILVVTFTNAAASDLKARILESIHKTRVKFEEIRAIKDYRLINAKISENLSDEKKSREPLSFMMKEYFDSFSSDDEAKSTISSYIRILKRAEASIDNAPISTIHSFCNKALNRIFTFEAGRAFNVELTQDTSKQDEEAKLSVFRELFYRSASHEPELIKELAQISSPSDFKDTIENLKKVRLLDDSKGYYGFSVKLDSDDRTAEQKQDPDKRIAHLLSSFEADRERALASFKTQIDFIRTRFDLSYRRECNKSGKPVKCYSIYDSSKPTYYKIKAEYEPLFETLEQLLSQSSINYGHLARLQKYTVPSPADGADSRYISNAAKANFTHREDVVQFEEHLNRLLLQVQDYFLAIKGMNNELMLLIAIKMIRRFDEICSRDAVLSNDELLRQLAVVLSAGDDRAVRLCSLLRSYYPVAMIDEFQDTDPVQYEIFSHLFLNEEAKAQRAVCYLIGDPKQSIYAFRGSDINSYNKAKENIIRLNGGTEDGCIYSLDTNYRSSKAVIDGVNAIFKEEKEDNADSLYLNNPFDYDMSGPKSRISFNAVESAAPYSKCGMLCIKISDSPCPDNGEDCVNITEGEHRGGYKILSGNTVREITLEEGVKVNSGQIVSACAQECALEILQCLTRGFFISPDRSSVQRVKPQHIAVLVSSGSQNIAVKKALEKYNIKSVYLSDKESVLASVTRKFGSDEVTVVPSQASSDMVYLMEAISDPTSQSKVLRLLGTRLLSLPENEFLPYVQSDALDSEMMLLKECNRKWEKCGFLPSFYHYLKAHKVQKRMLSLKDGNRMLTDYNHIAEIMQSVNSQILGINAQILWFKESVSDKDRLANISGDALKRLESEMDLIKVITIHKSKGLQYPIVFMPFAYNNQRKFSFDEISYADGALTLVKDGLCSSIEYERLKQHAQNQEQVRLLYVGLTRAQAANFIYYHSIKPSANQGDDSAFKKVIEPKGGAGDRKAISCEELFEKSSDIFSNPDADAVYQEEAVFDKSAKYAPNSLLQKVDTRFTVTSYTAIAAGHGTHTSLEEGKDSDLGFDDLSKTAKTAKSDYPQFHFKNGKNIGTFLHKVLEILLSCPKANRDSEDGIYSIIESSLKYDCFNVTGAISDGSRMGLFCSWMNTVMNSALPVVCAGACLNSLEKTDALKELEYFIPAHGFDVQAFNLVCEEFFEFLKQQLKYESLNRASLAPVSCEDFEGYIKGSIDLVARFRNKDSKDVYYLIDYKSNNLGDSLAYYDEEHIVHSILESKYHVQILLYTLALHRFLKLNVKAYEYDRDFGGVMYLYLRGMSDRSDDFSGIFSIKPPLSLVNRLSDMMDGIRG